MLPRPFEELEALARERYRARYANVPEPTPVNVDAVMVFTQPREFAWGGVGYRAPPLSFRDGVRLLVAAHALRDLRGAPAPIALRAAVLVAAHLVRRSVRPTAWLRRLAWRFARRPFAERPAEELEALIHWLLYAPDASPVAPPDGPVRVDFMDGLMGFVAAFPAWTGADGLPLSWAHWVYGSRHLSRAFPRQQIRMAHAVRAAGADRQDFAQWEQELRAAGGWN